VIESKKQRSMKTASENEIRAHSVMLPHAHRYLPSLLVTASYNASECRGVRICSTVVGMIAETKSVATHECAFR